MVVVMPIRRRSSLAAAALAAALLVPAAAHANGRFPDTIDVLFQPGDHDVLALQATWGLIISRDGGTTWRWICEEAVGFAGVYDPDYAFTSTGLLLATTTSADYLRLTRDGCAWTQAPPPLGSTGDGDSPTFVSQVEVASDGTIYAAASDATDTQLYRSTDDGASFVARSNPDDGHEWWESMVVVPSDPPAPPDQQRLYLTGYDLVGNGRTFVALRSDDGGQSWTNLPLTAFTFGADGQLTELQIAAVSPTDPDLVFARVYQANGLTIGDDIYRSDDAGASWTRVFQAGDDVTAVLVRGNGDVVLTTRLSGVHVSTNGGVSFGAALESKTMNCLRERDDGVLFACSKSFVPDAMALGRGTTVGDYTSLVTFDAIEEPVVCPPGTAQHDACFAMRWCPTVCQFGIDDPDCPACILVDAGPAPDAGTSTPPKDCTDCSSGGPAGGGLMCLLAAIPMLRRRKRR